MWFVSLITFARSFLYFCHTLIINHIKKLVIAWSILLFCFCFLFGSTKWSPVQWSCVCFSVCFSVCQEFFPRTACRNVLFICIKLGYHPIEGRGYCLFWFLLLLLFFVCFFDRRSEVLYNAVCLFSVCLSFFPGTLVEVFWFFAWS